MMKKLLLFLTFLSILGQVHSQEETTPNETKSKKVNHGLGLAGGATSAYGPSYRIFIDRLGAFLTYGPYKNDEYSRQNVGFGLLFMLKEGPKANLFLYQSNYYYKEVHTYQGYDGYTGKLETIDQTTKYTNHGVGLGIEFIIAKTVGFNIMAGYGAYKDFEDINVTAEGALYYRF